MNSPGGTAAGGHSPGLSQLTSVILADEPTGNLDSQTGLQVLSVLSDLNRNQGQTILIATIPGKPIPWPVASLPLKTGKFSKSGNVK